MNQRANGRTRYGRNVGAAWAKSGATGPFLSLELEAGALLADAFAAMLRGEDRVAYFAFVNEKDPQGSERQPDHRIVRPLRRTGPDDDA